MATPIGCDDALRASELSTASGANLQDDESLPTSLDDGADDWGGFEKPPHLLLPPVEGVPNSNRPAVDDGCNEQGGSMPQLEQDGLGADGAAVVNPVGDGVRDAATDGDSVGVSLSTDGCRELSAFPDDVTESAAQACASAPVGDSGDISAPEDEFGDFSKAADDFGCFSSPSDQLSSFSAPASPMATAAPAVAVAGFADFGAMFASSAEEPAPLVVASRQLAEPAGSDEDEDEFGDFDDYQAPCAEPAAIVTVEAISSLLASLFPLSPDEREPVAPPLDAGRVWYQLREPDNTAALQYRWLGSRANTDLLRALRVDANNIVSFGGWDTSPFPAGLDADPMQPTGGSPAARRDPAPGREVPPAAFDWDSSGLKNPLDDSGPGCSLLDLDVFDTNTCVVAASNSFLSCLERELLTAESSPPPQPPPPPPPPSTTGSVYSQLMAQTADRPLLSEAAERVVARIPNIDFMQAKVLMFPVHGE